MQKIRKILRAVSEKTALPTNQPTNQPIITNTDFIGPDGRRSKKIEIPANLPLIIIVNITKFVGVILEWKNFVETIH